jgi:hypothetical protein
MRDRRLGVGEIDADQRHALPRGGPAPVRLGGRAVAVRGDRGARAFRQGHQRRPESDRPHAALQPGDVHGTVHADPRAVRASEGSARARLRPGAVLVQRQGRALRGLPGRRTDQGRDAFPSRRLRALRRLPRPALQPRDARNPLQGPQCPRGAGDDCRAGVRFLRPGAGRGAQALDAARRGPRLHQARAVGDDAVGRGGAAGEARAGVVETRHRPYALHPGRAHDRPSLPRYRDAAFRAAPAARSWQHRRGDRA